MKKGDKVRFLNEIGGGIVSGFRDKNIVLVEDSDGFEIPMSVTDVVVVTDENYSTTNMVKPSGPVAEVRKQAQGEKHQALRTVSDDPSEGEITFRAPVEERKGGNVLSCYLAFVPVDIKEISNTRFECYFVNDSNYFVRFTCLVAEGNSWTLRSTLEVEPNTKEFMEEIGREDLNDLSRIGIQLLAYKRDKPFQLKPAVDVQLRIDAVKFYKLHTFRENDFFEQPALLYTIVENDDVARSLVVDADAIKKQMYAKEEPQKKPQPQKRKGDEGVVVVDLHADELLETTAGMSNVDILNYQLDVFRKTIEENKKRKGQRLIFIHGKGEGVLRQAIIKELHYRYKTFLYQDASFREYGYGATQVTIR